MKIIYLSPWFYTYRVPVFDEFFKRLGSHFLVISYRNQPNVHGQLAQTQGVFQRKLIGGREFTISRRHDEGDETPFNFHFSPKLTTTLKTNQPDFVISNNFSIWSLTAILMGYPTVLFWEGTQHTERTVSVWRNRLRQWMAGKAHAFVVTGTLARRYLVDIIKVPDHKIFEHGMCASSPPAALKTRRDRTDNSMLRFVCVAQLIGRKGIRHLLHAAKKLKNNDEPFRNFEIILVGCGPEKQNLTNLTNQLDLTSVVRFTGQVAPKDIWHIYAEADVFVLPTLQDNWPLVVLEAMSSGLPILLSKYAGNASDLMVPGLNGYIFDPTNHKELADLLAAYIRTPSMISSQGKSSLEIARSYTPEAVVNSFFSAIESIKRK